MCIEDDILNTGKYTIVCIVRQLCQRLNLTLDAFISSGGVYIMSSIIICVTNKKKKAKYIHSNVPIFLRDVLSTREMLIESQSNYR